MEQISLDKALSEYTDILNKLQESDLEQFIELVETMNKLKAAYMSDPAMFEQKEPPPEFEVKNLNGKPVTEEQRRKLFDVLDGTIDQFLEED